MPDRLPTAGELARRRFDPHPQEDPMDHHSRTIPPDVAPMPLMLDSLSAQLERLDHQAERLAQKLEPVLAREAGPGAVLEADGPLPLEAPLVSQVRVAAEVVERVADRLADLANRCAL